MEYAIADEHRPVPAASPRTAVIMVAALVIVLCLGFAAANVLLETTDWFPGPKYSRAAAEHSETLAVMNGLVIVLKVLGAVLALLSVTARQRLLRPTALGVLLWAAFSTLAVYNLGSIAEGVGMATGLIDLGASITLADLGYVLFFAVFATGFGVLAISYARRHHLPARHAVAGAFGAPVVLGGLLVVAPAILGAFGLGLTA